MTGLGKADVTYLSHAPLLLACNELVHLLSTEQSAPYDADDGHATTAWNYLGYQSKEEIR